MFLLVEKENKILSCSIKAVYFYLVFSQIVCHLIGQFFYMVGVISQLVSLA